MILVLEVELVEPDHYPLSLEVEGVESQYQQSPQEQHPCPQLLVAHLKEQEGERIH